MNFLTGNELNEAIRTVCKGSKVRCAVAFWGKGAETLFHPQGEWKIICNLNMGGTNPYAIRKIAGDKLAKLDRVRQHDKLHAKIYLNDHEAIVTSANASANGLGQEDKELSGWIETGVRITTAEELEALRAWFTELWDKKAKRITSENLDEAEAIWKWRRRIRIPRPPESGSLLKSLKNHLDERTDRGISVYIHAPLPNWSDAAAEAWKVEKKARQDSKIAGWEVTEKDEMGPEKSAIMDFDYVNGKAKLTGICELLDSVKVGRKWVQLCRPVEKSDSLEIGKGHKKIWQDAATQALR